MVVKYDCVKISDGKTVKGSPMMICEVEMPEGKVQMPYFGVTTPQYVTEIGYFKDGNPYIKNIQPHTMRDATTGRYKGGYRKADDE